MHSLLCCANTSICVDIQWIKELIQLKSNPPKKTHQLDQFPLLFHSLRKNNETNTAQSIVTVQGDMIDETFLFGLHPYA